MGQTLIDALIVTLDLKSDGFEKNQKQARESQKKTTDAATASGKEMEARAKRTGEAYAKFRGEVIALFAAFTAGVGLKQFIGDTIKSEATLGRMAHALDMSVENLSAWQGVLKRNGGTAEDATGAFRTLADALADVQTTGNTAKGGILLRMGVQASDLKNPEQAIVKMANVARTMDPVIASSLLRQVGFTEAMTNAMLQGGDALQAQIEAQRKLGVTTAADVAAAQRLQNSLEGLKTASARLGAQILTVLEPAINFVARAFSGLASWAQNNQPIVFGFLVGVTALVGALTVALLPLIAAEWALLAPLMPFVAIIAAVAIGLGALYEVVTRGTHALLQFMRSHQATRDAMREVSDAARDLWAAIKSALAPLRPVFDALADGFQTIKAALGDAFGDAGLVAARVFINFLTNGLHAIADALRVVAALLRGDFKGALAAAGDFNKDMSANLLAKTPGRDSRVAPGAVPSVAPQAAPGSTNVTAFMQAKGFTAQQAAGIAAGVDAESKTNPNAVNKKSGAFGIGQWLGKRKAELFRRYGSNPTLAQQLEFLAWELRGGDAGGRAVQQSSTAQGALQAYVTKFMRPAQGAETEGDMARGLRFLAANGNAPPIVNAGTAAALAANGSGAGGRTTHVTVQIDNLAVNAPQARDASGIAAGIEGAIRKRADFVPQVSTGLS